MSQQNLFVSSLIGILVLGVVALGFVALSDPPPPDPEAYVARTDHDDLLARNIELQDLFDRSQEENAELAEKRKELESRVAELKAELHVEHERAAAEAEAELAANASNVPIAFGQWAELEGVKNANWPEMGEAIGNMNALMVELVASMQNGEVPSAELQEKIREENNKLVRYAAQVMGKIPTHSPINGEFSHPITVANLIDSVLEGTELALNEDQRAAIASFGEDYDRGFDRLQSTYSDETTRLEKLIDELELKRDTKRSMESVLTPDQRELLTPAAIRDRSQVDPLSPAVMTAMIAGAKNVKSVDELRGRLPEYLGEWFGIKNVAPETLGAIADSWMEEMRPILTPVERATKFLELDQTITAGRAQVNAMKQLLSLQDLDEKARKAILNHMGWRVPQVVEASPE